MPANAPSHRPAVFDLAPAIVRFTASSPHTPLTTLVTVTNRSPQPQQLHVTPPHSHTLTLTPASPHTANKLATGMSHTYTLTYTPALLHPLQDCLWVESGEGSRQQLPIVCSGPCSRIQVRGPHSTLRTIVGGEGRTVLSADNLSGWPVLASFRLSSDEFRVTEPDIRLAAGEFRQVVLAFQPVRPGQHSAQLTYTLRREDGEGEEEVEGERVEVVGECEDLTGQIVLSESEVRMPSTFMTLASQHTVTLTNHSAYPSAFTLTTPSATSSASSSSSSSSSSPFRILPTSGLLYPNASCDLLLVFHPPSSSPPAFSSTFHLAASGLPAPLPLRVHGDGLPPSLCFSPSSHVDLGVVDMQREVCFVLQLENEGRIEAGWRWAWEWQAGRGGGEGGGIGGGRGRWDVDVKEGRLGVRSEVREANKRERAKLRLLAADDSQDDDEEAADEAELPSSTPLTLSFLPTHVGPFVTQLPFSLSSSSAPLLLTIKASIVGPQLSLSHKRIELSTVGMGVQRTERLRITNDSHIAARASAKIATPDSEWRIDGQPAVHFTLDGRQSMELLVSFEPLSTRPNGLSVEERSLLLLDVEGVADALFSVPLLATPITPPLRLSLTEMQLSSVFLRHAQCVEVQLLNDSDTTLRALVASDDEEVELSSTSLLVPARSSVPFAMTVMAATLQAREVIVTFRSLGSMLCCPLTLSYQASGPLVSLSSAKLAFPLQACLTSSSLPVTLTNSSPIPAHVSPVFHTKRCPFTVPSTAPFTLPPHSSHTLSVTFAPIEPATSVSASLSFLITDADPLSLLLTSSTYGSSVHSSLPSTSTTAQAFSFAPALSPAMLTQPFTLTNHSTRRQRLTWEHVPHLSDADYTAKRRLPVDAPAADIEAERKRLEYEAMLKARKANVAAAAAGQSTAPPTTFRPQPATLTLDGQHAVECALRATQTGNGGLVASERWVCTSLTDGDRSSVVIADWTFHARFYTPTLSFQPATSLAFEYLVQPTDDIQQPVRVSKCVSITNPLPCTVDCQLLLPPTFSAAVDRLSLTAGQSYLLWLTFSPDLTAYSRTTRVRDDHLRCRFTQTGTGTGRHQQQPHKDATLLLRNEVHFPNWADAWREVDFGCVVPEVSKRLVRTVTNEGRLPLHYRWLVQVGGVCDVFDISPMVGTVLPGEAQQFDLTFHSPALPFDQPALHHSTVVRCEVAGGPVHEVRLVAATSELSYSLVGCDTAAGGSTRGVIAFGGVRLGAVMERQLVVVNDGELSFDFRVDGVQSDYFSTLVDPSTTITLARQERHVIPIRFNASSILPVEAELTVHIAALPPQRVRLSAFGVYASYYLHNQPRLYPTELDQQLWLHSLEAADSQLQTSEQAAMNGEAGLAWPELEALYEAVGEAGKREMLAERLMWQSMLPSARSLPAAHYALTFPPSQEGEERSLTLTVTNTSPLPLPLSVPAASLSSTVFTVTLPAAPLQPGETGQVVVTSHGVLQQKTKKGQSPPSAVGNHTLSIPLCTASPLSPPLYLDLSSAVYRPAVILSTASARLNNVRIGQRAEHYLYLHNSHPIPATWSVKPPTGVDGLRLWPESGRLDGGERQLLAVLYTPAAVVQEWKGRVCIRVDGGSSVWLALSLSSFAPSFTLSTPTVSLPPLLPHSVSEAATFTLSNESNVPIKVVCPNFDSSHSAALASLASLTTASTLLLEAGSSFSSALIRARLRQQAASLTSPLPSHLGYELLTPLTAAASLMSPVVVNVLVAGVYGGEDVEAVRRAIGVNEAAVIAGVDECVHWYARLADDKKREDDRVRQQEEERDRRVKDIAKRREKAKGKKEETDKLNVEEADELARPIAPTYSFTAEQWQLAAQLQPSIPAVLPPQLLVHLLSAYVQRESYAAGCVVVGLASAYMGQAEVASCVLAAFEAVASVRESRLYVVVCDRPRDEWQSRLDEREAKLSTAATPDEKKDDKAAKGKKPAAAAAGGEEEREKARQAIADERRRGEERYALDVSAVFGCGQVQPVWTLEMSAEEREWRERQRLDEEEQRKEEERRRAESAELRTSTNKAAKDKVKRESVLSTNTLPLPTQSITSVTEPPQPAASPLPPPPLMTSAPTSSDTAKLLSSVKLRRFDGTSTAARLQDAVHWFVKQEAFAVFDNPVLPSFTPFTVTAPAADAVVAVPPPAVYDIVHLPSGAATAPSPPTALSVSGGGLWVVPAHGSIDVEVKRGSGSALGIFTETLTLLSTFTASSAAYQPALLTVSSVVTVPTITLELRKDKRRKAGKARKGDKRWSKSAGRFDFGRLLTGKRRPAEGEAAGPAGEDERHVQQLLLTNTSPFEVSLEIAMEHARISMIEEEPAATPADPKDKKAAAAKAKPPASPRKADKGKQKGTAASTEEDEKEEEKRQLALQPVFSTSTTTASIPVGGQLVLSLYAYPQSLASLTDTLVIAIEDNPLPVLFPLVCCGVSPSLQLSSERLVLPRTRVGCQQVVDELVLINPTPFTLTYSLAASTLPPFITLPQPTPLAAGERRPLPVAVQATEVAKGEHQLRLDTLDMSGARLGETQLCTISSDVYACDVSVEVSGVKDAALAFGDVRVGETVELELTLDNKGKSDLLYNITLPAASPLASQLTFTPASGQLAKATKERVVVQLNTPVDEVVDATTTAITIEVREKAEDNPLQLSLPVSYTSSFARISVSPEWDKVAGCDFGWVEVSGVRERRWKVRNEGRKEVRWELFDGSTGKKAEEKARRKLAADEERAKREAAAAAAPVDGKKIKADKPGSASKGAAAGKDGKGAVGAAAAPVAAPTTLTLSAFTITPASGVLAPGEEVELCLRLDGKAEGQATALVELEVEGTEKRERQARLDRQKKRRDELKRKPWLRLNDEEEKAREDKERADEETDDLLLLPLHAHVGSAQLSREWSGVMAGQSMRDRRRDEAKEGKPEVSEFVLEDEMLVFGCVRLAGGPGGDGTAGGEGEAKEEGKKDGKKTAGGKDKKAAAATESKDGAAAAADRREERRETIRLINSSAVEAHVYLTLTPTVQQPPSTAFQPSSLAAPEPAVAAEKGKKGKEAAAVPISSSATALPLCGAFALSDAKVVIPPLSSAPLTITYTPSAATLSNAHLTAYVQHSLSSLHLQLQAEAVREVITVSVAALDFDRVRAGQQRQLPLRLRNDGKATARLRCQLLDDNPAATPRPDTTKEKGTAKGGAAAIQQQTVAVGQSAPSLFSLDASELVVEAGNEVVVLVSYQPPAASTAASALHSAQLAVWSGTSQSSSTTPLLSVPVRGEAVVQDVRVTDGVDEERDVSSSATSNRYLPILDMGEMETGSGGRVKVFRLTNSSQHTYRYTITAPLPPSSESVSAASVLTMPPPTSSAAKKKPDVKAAATPSAATAAVEAAAMPPLEPDFNLTPSLGHLLPGRSALIRVEMKSDLPRVYRQARVAIDVQKIERRPDDSGSSVSEWDDEMRQVRWISVDEQRQTRAEAEQRAREEAERLGREREEAEAKLKKPAGKSVPAKTPRQASQQIVDLTPATAAALPDITAPIQHVTPVPEPAYTAIDTATVSVPLYVSAVVDVARLVVQPSGAMAFKETFVYQKREVVVSVSNESALSLPFEWQVEGEGFALYPSSGVVAGNGKVKVSVRFAPERDGSYTATATLVCSASSASASPVTLQLSGSATRPLFHMQLPPSLALPSTAVLPAGVSADTVHVLDCCSLGINVRTLVRFPLLNTSNEDWQYGWQCEDSVLPHEPTPQPAVKEEEEKTTEPLILPAITPAASSASSLVQSSPSQPFACQTSRGRLAAGEKQEMVFAFSPTAATPTAPAPSSLWSFHVDGRTVYVLLAGRVVEPAVSVSQSAVLFEPTVVSHKREQQLTLINSSSIPLSFHVLLSFISPSASSPSPAAASLVSSPDRGVLSPHSSLPVTLRFNPGAAGVSEWRLVVVCPRKRERLYVRVAGEGYSLKDKVFAVEEAGLVGGGNGRSKQGETVREEESKEQIRGEVVERARWRK